MSKYDIDKLIIFYKNKVPIPIIMKEIGIGNTHLYRLLKKNNIITHPKGSFIRGRKPWNKGLTITDERVKKGNEKGLKTRKLNHSYKPNSGNFKKGIKPWWIVKNLPHPMRTEEGRKKQSETKKRLFKEGKLEGMKGDRNPMYGRKPNNNQLKGLLLGQGRKGKDNNFWKGGVTPFHIRLRTIGKYKTWRNNILKRDKCCKKCKSKYRLHAHHLISFSSLLEKHNIKTVEEAKKCKVLWDLDIAIMLCEKCHEKVHGRKFHIIYK